MIGMIVAVDQNNLIGYDGKIPWRKPEDLKRFKEKTTGSVIIEGRKTFESIGKCLPNRVNIVLSSQPLEYWLKHEASAEDKSVIRQVPIISKSVSLALEVAQAEHPEKDVWIIGGSQIYDAALPFVKKIELTTVLQKTEVADSSKAVYLSDHIVRKLGKEFYRTNREYSSQGDMMFDTYEWCERFEFSFPPKFSMWAQDMSGKKPPLGALIEDNQGNQWVVIQSKSNRDRTFFTDTTGPDPESTFVLELHKKGSDNFQFMTGFHHDSWRIVQQHFRKFEEKT
jgi:dihydrofolate reductase